jgi:hypothetical protein
VHGFDETGSIFRKKLGGGRNSGGAFDLSVVAAAVALGGWVAAPFVRSRFPLLSAGATSAYASRFAQSAANIVASATRGPRESSEAARFSSIAISS